MEFHRKQLIDKFEGILFENYRDYCQRYSITPSFEGLITFLVDFEIISPKAITKYTIRQEFEQLYPQKEYHKTNTVLQLADRYNLSERSIWSILKGRRPRAPLPTIDKEG